MLSQVDAPLDGIAPSITPKPRPTLWAHVQIARMDHWVKNVFVLPGVIVALSLDRSQWNGDLIRNFLVGLLAVCLVTSSNYVINEILDAPYDRQHPVKRHRPVPSGKVSLRWGYVQWIVLMLVGMIVAAQVSVPFLATMLALWFMGCVYNIPPVRSKDVPYLDVLSEAVNNPLRMLAGWYITQTTLLPPISLLMSYWMVGCYFMAIKRFAEYRDIGNPIRSGNYRRSFKFYNETRLLVSIMFYATHAMLFFGAFIIRYKLELILSFPLVALVMAIYLMLSFERDSSVQRPEKLHRSPSLMASVIVCWVVMMTLMFCEMPALDELFPLSVSR